MTIDELIKAHSIKVLKRNGWSVNRTAKELGVCKRTLGDWMTKWRDEGIKIPFFTEEHKRRYLASKVSRTPTEGIKTLRTDE